MRDTLKRFFKEEEGSIVEYLLLIAVAAIIAAFLFPGLRDNIVRWFNDMVARITNGIEGSDGSCTVTTNNNTTCS